MAQKSCKTLDPRIRRTRQLLQQALDKLLETKEFDQISVQDIADAATVNRATFYDHFSDKFALLECMVASRFQELLEERQVCFDGTCGSALTTIVLAVCDYLARRQVEPHTESAIIAVVGRILLEGLKRREQKTVAPEMIAAAASWAIYGAAKEWARTPGRAASEEIAETVATIVAPILRLPNGGEHPGG